MKNTNSGFEINGTVWKEGDMALYEDDGYLGSGVAIIQETWPTGADMNVIYDNYSRSSHLTSSTTITKYTLSPLGLDDPRRRKTVQHLSMLAAF